MIGFSFAVYLFHDVAEAISVSAENIKKLLLEFREGEGVLPVAVQCRNTQTSPFH